MRNFTKEDPAVANSFFQQFLLAMLGDVFYVLTDTDHKSGRSTISDSDISYNRLSD